MKKKKAFLNGMSTGNWDELSRSEDDGMTEGNESIMPNNEP
jgi:hypothetical protein